MVAVSEEEIPGVHQSGNMKGNLRADIPAHPGSAWNMSLAPGVEMFRHQTTPESYGSSPDWGISGCFERSLSSRLALDLQKQAI